MFVTDFGSRVASLAISVIIIIADYKNKIRIFCSEDGCSRLFRADGTFLPS
jgi:hypothetical protein